MDDGEIGTMQSMGMAPRPEVEIEVDAIQRPQQARPNMVIIRVNEDIEDMTLAAGNRVERYSFIAGNRYEVPIYIANELEAVGKLWH
jgi:hypothetical protein